MKQNRQEALLVDDGRFGFKKKGLPQSLVGCLFTFSKGGLLSAAVSLVACRRRAVQVTRFDGGAEHVQAAARVADI